MEPNYNKAAHAASDIAVRFGTSDPLSILKKLRGVLLMAHSTASDEFSGIFHDAFTMVDRIKGRLCYIILYSRDLSPYRLRFALARELGHIALKHDGSATEEIWLEESNCFAYHFLCAPVRPVVVYYRPSGIQVTAAFKEMQTFNSLEDLKQAVADEQTRLSSFIGHPDVVYSPSDIEIRSLDSEDVFGGWKNYSSVVVAGRPVGYCGE